MSNRGRLAVPLEQVCAACHTMNPSSYCLPLYVSSCCRAAASMS